MMMMVMMIASATGLAATNTGGVAAAGSNPVAVAVAVGVGSKLKSGDLNGGGAGGSGGDDDLDGDSKRLFSRLQNHRGDVSVLRHRALKNFTYHTTGVDIIQTLMANTTLTEIHVAAYVVFSHVVVAVAAASV